MPSRGKTVAHGYGRLQKALRRKWERLVAAGGVACARCQQPIFPSDAWDLGHSDDRTFYTGPEHVYCNRAAPRNVKRRFSREW